MYKNAIRQFTNSLNALRDFVDLIDPFLTTKTTSLLDKHGAVLRPLAIAFQKVDPSAFSSVPLSIEEKAALEKSVKVDIKESKDKKRKSVSIEFEAPDGSDPKAALEALTEITKNKRRVSLLFNSSLISLVSAVECFFSRLLHGYFAKHPQAGVSSDKSFTYEDLTHFSTLDDARQHLIERKVEDILRGSYSDWIKYFRQSVKLSMSYADAVMDDLVETCERRNIHVHNNGLANRIYMSKVCKAHADQAQLGKPLIVDRKYLDNAIGLFEKICILVAAELWKHLQADDDSRGSVLIETASDHMQHGRWIIAEGLNLFVCNDKKLSERIIMTGKMNYWLCCKRLGRWDEIKLKVAEEDMTARDRLFQLEHLALGDKRKEFFELLPKAISGGDVQLPQLESLPIFEDMRRDEQFQKALKKLRDKKPKSRKTANSTASKTMSSRAALPEDKAPNRKNKSRRQQPD